MDTLTSLFLSAAIAGSDSYDSSREKAIRTLALYQYKEQGLDKKVKSIQRQYMPEEMKSFTGLAAGAYTILVRKKVELVWTF